jgi:hypothetical protein
VVKAHRLADLVGLGTLSDYAARFLEVAVAVGLNVDLGAKPNHPLEAQARSLVRMEDHEEGAETRPECDDLAADAVGVPCRAALLRVSRTCEELANALIDRARLSCPSAFA